MTPGSPEWQKLITASKVAAILGVSPWDSPRSVWHAMRGDLPREPATDAQSRGHYLEPAILAWWRDKHDVGHDEGREYRLQPEYLLETWAAATPDMVACHPDDDTVLVEAKSAAYDNDWGDPGTDAIPAYYLCQVFWQMHVSGIHRCYVPVIFGRGLRFAEYVVDYVPEYGAALEAKMREFYDSLAGDPPDLDDTVATYEAVRKVHKDIERGEEVELDGIDAEALVLSHASLKDMEAIARRAKSVVIDAMGRAQYATHNGVRIARRQPRGEDVTFVVVAKPEDLSTEENAA